MIAKKRFTVKRHLFKDQTHGGWYVWDREANSWDTCIENAQGGFEKRSDALKAAEEMNRREYERSKNQIRQG